MIPFVVFYYNNYIMRYATSYGPLYTCDCAVQG
jgi:hypothetical protein